MFVKRIVPIDRQMDFDWLRCYSNVTYLRSWTHMIGKLLEHARRKDAFRLGAWRECSGPVSGRSKEKQYKSLILFDSP